MGVGLKVLGQSAHCGIITDRSRPTAPGVQHGQSIPDNCADELYSVSPASKCAIPREDRRTMAPAAGMSGGRRLVGLCFGAQENGSGAAKKPARFNFFPKKILLKRSLDTLCNVV